MQTAIHSSSSSTFNDVGPTTARNDVNVGLAGSMGKHSEYLRLFGDVPGWFEAPAIAAWDALLEFQSHSGVRGNLLEIGVWKGKSAGMMALHSRKDEICVLVDWSPLEEPLARISQASPYTKCIGVRQSSDEFRYSSLCDSLRNSVRWMHIDGGHSADQVIRDLEMANLLLASDGIVALDDFFSAGYPQVTEAVFRTMHDHPGQFALVLVGFNKGYLCRPSAAKDYLRFIKDSMHQEMASRDCGSVTFWKTNGSSELNAFGMVQGGTDSDPYRGLDTDHEDIQI